MAIACTSCPHFIFLVVNYWFACEDSVDNHHYKKDYFKMITNYLISDFDLTIIFLKLFCMDSGWWLSLIYYAMFGWKKWK